MINATPRVSAGLYALHMSLKAGAHYPCSRPVNTGRKHG